MGDRLTEMSVKFTKMHGLGNDFVMINAVSQPLEITSSIARKISNRHTGVGCDQLLIVEPSTDSEIDFFYRILNHDGTEVGQCGNGARCLARFVHEQGLTSKRDLTVKTITTTLKLKINSLDNITVYMGIPEFEPELIPFTAKGRQDHYHFEVDNQLVYASVLALGNPHCIQFVDDIESAPVNTQGPKIESSELFPRRTNACYAQVIDQSRIKARVYERGAGETMACGSGACAIMVAAKQKGLVDENVTVELLGGPIKITWPGEGRQVEMTGPAVRVFESELDLESL